MLLEGDIDDVSPEVSLQCNSSWQRSRREYFARITLSMAGALGYSHLASIIRVMDVLSEIISVMDGLGC